jgi:hypothetical protein
VLMLGVVVGHFEDEVRGSDGKRSGCEGSV